MSDNTDGVTGCGCGLLVLAMNLLIGGFAFQYALKALFYKDVAWYWDVIGGLFLGELAIPLAVIIWILNHIAGIPTPFFG